jgi:hypothetical protein
MIPLYNIATATIGICTAAAILILIRKDKLSVNYSLGWAMLSGGLIFFGIVPPAVDWIGKKLGINYPPILLVITAICLIFLKLLFMDIHRSKHERQIKVLTQRLALYENEISNNKSTKSEDTD